MQCLGIPLQFLQPRGIRRLGRAVVRLNLLALLSKSFQALVALVQFFQEGLDSLLVHAKPHALSNLIPVVIGLLRVCSQ